MNPTATLISTAASLSRILPSLTHLPTSPPSLYIDLEGTKLSRHGSISLITMFVPPISAVYLIDVHTMGAAAFTTPVTSQLFTPLAAPQKTISSTAPMNTASITLKSILESSIIPKVIFDLRNDSDALFAHYSINLSCVQDLQLMELATRKRRRTFLSGLKACISYDLPLSPCEITVWNDIKSKGLELYAPEKGGSYEVFNERPLRREILDYCVQDVVRMPELTGSIRRMGLGRNGGSWRSRGCGKRLGDRRLI